MGLSWFGIGHWVVYVRRETAVMHWLNINTAHNLLFRELQSLLNAEAKPN